MTGQKTLNEAWNELEKTKENFWNNHERRMNELKETINRIDFEAQNSEFDKKIAQTDKDLDDLLK